MKFKSLKTYFADISRYPILTVNEERELADRVFTAGDRQASQQLIVSNLRLVVKVALNYYSAYLNVLDLIQEGNVGLIHAARKYNPHKGPRFSTYASFWIRAHILKHIMHSWGMVKIGTTDNQRKVFFGLNRAKRQFHTMGVEPNVQDLAHALDVTEEDIRMMERRLSSPDIPLDSFDDTQGCLETVEGNENIEEIVSAKERSDVLQELIPAFKQRLDDRDAFILENRTMADCPLTLKEIGRHFGISRERVRQLEGILLKRLKANLKQSVLIRKARNRNLAQV